MQLLQRLRGRVALLLQLCRTGQLRTCQRCESDPKAGIISRAEGWTPLTVAAEYRVPVATQQSKRTGVSNPWERPCRPLADRLLGRLECSSVLTPGQRGCRQVARSVLVRRCSTAGGAEETDRVRVFATTVGRLPTRSKLTHIKPLEGSVCCCCTDPSRLAARERRITFAALDRAHITLAAPGAAVPKRVLLPLLPRCVD
eukprot:7377015-Prymnesium_polylepis.3